MSLLTKYTYPNKPAKMAMFSLLIFTTVTSFFCQAESDKADTGAPLPLGVVLDSEGNPISLPKQNRSALEFRSPEVKKTDKYSPLIQPRKKKPRTKKLSRKQQLTSRSHVANDPSCRWLNSRMNKLEESLASAGNSSANSYHKKELVIRNKEWKCMKCGVEGPEQKDYDRCQYRR